MPTEQKAAQKKNPISEVAALAQIQSLLDYYGIDKEDIEIEDGAEAVQTMYNTLVRAIRRGVLEISSENKELIVTHRLTIPVALESGEVSEIVYRDKVGKAKIAMDTESLKKQQTRMNIFMATMGDTTLPVLIGLKGFDETVKSRIQVVFSMV